MTQVVRKKLAQQLCEGRSLLAVMVAAAQESEGRRALEHLLAKSDMSLLSRRAVVRWAAAQRRARHEATLGPACDHATVLPLRVALFPAEHAAAAKLMLSGVCAAMPARAAEAQAAWARFRTWAALDAAPALKLGDTELREIRERFALHPILGLLWAAAQTVDWTGGSSGWRHVRESGIHPDATIRVAETMPRGVGRRVDAPEGGPQISVGQRVCYPKVIERWCPGAVLVCYGCAECHHFDGVNALQPKHILLFGTRGRVRSLALSLTRHSLTRHSPTRPLAHSAYTSPTRPLCLHARAEIDAATLAVCGASLLRHADRMRASIMPLSFEGWTAEAQLRALGLRCARHVAITYRPGSVLPPPGSCPGGAHVFFAGFGDPKPIGWAETAPRVYGYARAERSAEGGGAMMHLSSVPHCATVTPPKPLAAQPAYDFVTPPRRR